MQCYARGVSTVQPEYIGRVSEAFVRMIRAWLSRIGNIFDKRHRDRELSEELESHLSFTSMNTFAAGCLAKKRAAKL